MDISTILQEVLMFVGIVSLGAITYSVFTYVKSKVNNAKINEAIDIILDTVDKVSQTFVDKLKQSNDFSKENQIKALNQALEEIKALMPDAIKKYIEKNFNDVDQWIINKIESYIKRTNPEIEMSSQKLNG